MTSPTDELSPAPAEIIDAYLNGIDELVGAVAGMTSDQLRARPIAGKWSSLEVVCHLADCDQFFAERIKRTIALDRPLLIAVDTDHYVASLSYQQHDVQEEVDLVATTRRQLARSLRLMPLAAWQRPAVHSEKGLVTLHQMLQYAVNHLKHHLVFIAEKRAALKS